MIITNWFIRTVFLIVLLLLAVVCTFFPVLIAKIITFGPWINPEFEDLLKPRVRERRQLLQENPSAYAERYPDDLEPIRTGGLVAWLWFLFALCSLLYDMHIFW